MSGLILYTSEDGRSRIQLRADGQTVWLTQAEMAELFDVSADNNQPASEKHLFRQGVGT